MPRLPERRVVEGLALSTGAMAASTFGTLSFPAIAPLVRDQFDLSEIEVGLFTALVFLGAMFASVPAGRLTDRWGAPVMLAVAQAGVAVGVGIAAVAPSRFLFLVGIGVAGLAYGGVNPPTNVMVSDSIPRRHRALLLSLKQTGVPIGALVGSAILPSIAVAVGWRWSLLVPIGVLLTAAALSLTVVRREAARLGAASPAPSARDESVGEAAPAPSLAPVGLYGFIMAGVQLSFVGYLTVYLVDDQSFSPSEAGFALALALGAGVAGRIVWGALSDGLFASHATSLALAGLGSATGLALLLLVDGGPALWLSMVLIGFCGIGWNGVFLALVADRATLGTLGRATGSTLLFLYAGVVAVPPLFGVLFGAVHSWPEVWAVAVGLTVGATLAMALAPRHLPAGIAPSPPAARPG